MIRDPDSLDALLRELLVERFYTTNRDIHQGHAIVDTPEAFAYRQRVLTEAMAESALDNVVPIRSDRRAA